MSRSPRTTKIQKEFIINFLDEHKELLGGRFNPNELPKINKLWEELAKELNNIGPPKIINQWKETVSEMKTSVRRRAREVRYSTSGTGGGVGVKQLSDMEERLMKLLSKLTTEGDSGLVEPGIAKDIPICIDSASQNTPENNPSSNSIIAIESEEHNDKQNKIKEPPKKSRKCKKRGESSVVNCLTQHDKILEELVKSNFAIAKSINALALAIKRKL